LKFSFRKTYQTYDIYGFRAAKPALPPAPLATFLRGVYTKLSTQTRQAGGKTTTLLINETTVLVKRYITKKLCVYDATKSDVDLCIKRRLQKRAQNQLKNSQLPFRRREKAM
tara:strand:- start:323 stop:658 length:336 start_codon:yes stop_codon:yes gene_type:complete